MGKRRQGTWEVEAVGCVVERWDVTWKIKPR